MSLKKKVAANKWLNEMLNVITLNKETHLVTSPTLQADSSCFLIQMWGFPRPQTLSHLILDIQLKTH